MTTTIFQNENLKHFSREQIDFFERGLCVRHHVSVQRFFGTLMNTRGIHVDRLIGTFRVHTEQIMAGRLRFARSDADFLAQHMIEQSGFAHVGPPQQGYIAAEALLRL